MDDWTISDDQRDLRIDADVGTIEPPPMQTIPVKAAAKAADEGPCLYLGPAGQRCYRRAIKGGFCAEHQPGATTRAKIGKRSKLVAAIIGIAGALWPYLYDFVHQLIRIFHPR